MRISIFAWMVSSAILTSGALLAALAHNSNERPPDRCTVFSSIGPRLG
jgi:hypothetical protein